MQQKLVANTVSITSVFILFSFLTSQKISIVHSLLLLRILCYHLYDTTLYFLYLTGHCLSSPLSCFLYSTCRCMSEYFLAHPMLIPSSLPVLLPITSPILYTLLHLKPDGFLSLHQLSMTEWHHTWTECMRQLSEILNYIVIAGKLGEKMRIQRTTK